jgi:ATP-dependent DNA ligase
MLATLVDSPFNDKAWVFETKWDGFRLITEKSATAMSPKSTRCSYQRFKRSRAPVS